VRNGNYGAALAELRSMKKVQPAQAYRYFYNQAFAESRMGQVMEAKAHAAKARSFTHNPEELASLEGLDRALAAPAAQIEPPADPARQPRLVRQAPAPALPH